jgi:hypothetical protein
MAVGGGFGAGAEIVDEGRSAVKMVWSADAEGFRSEWQHFRPNAFPLGWMLRLAEAEPWLRLHALPLSKRYAQSAREERLILARANWLADRLLGSGEPCLLVTVVDKSRSNIGYVQDIDAHDDVAHNYYLRATEVIWVAGNFDGLLSAIADDTERALWFNRKSGRVFAPYDGGFDLFPRDEAEVAAIAKRRKTWISKRPDGL